MQILPWPRIVLCGLVTGIAFTLMSAVLVSILGDALLASVSDRVAPGAGAARTGPALYFLTVAAGVWAMWLYAVIRPGSASNFRAALVVGLAWWVIASLQSLKWIVLLGTPTAAWLPLSLNAVMCIVAATIGASLFGAAHLAQPSRHTP